MEVKEEIKEVLNHLVPNVESFTFTQLKSGHINQTFKVVCNGKSFLLQKMNTLIFQNLAKVQENIMCVAQHLKEVGYAHTLLHPLPFRSGDYLFSTQWRAFKFTENTLGFEKVESEKQAFKAAQFLSEFLSCLDGLEPNKILNSLPGFLDFNARFEAFEKAITKSIPERYTRAEEEIKTLMSHRSILEEWDNIYPQLPQRIIHADPKISNFLFDRKDSTKIIALIDWDTLMQGPILYDFGDMIRSFTNLKAEDDPAKETVFSLANYDAVKKGFLHHLGEKMLDIEVNHLDLAAKTIIYIQSIRFLTDYLEGDIYYHIDYGDQNLNRAKNQLNMLEELINYVK